MFQKSENEIFCQLPWLFLKTSFANSCFFEKSDQNEINQKSFKHLSISQRKSEMLTRKCVWIREIIAFQKSYL